MLLSIGMIVKNEEKYLDRCLTALQPILDNVDSELIIADTGSEDSTVEIAKRHTDNVYSFEWINDFAAARNSTYDRAQGEWYMFIDADEILQNCDDIIHFFNSGEYRKYKSASYTIRSYSEENNRDSFMDSQGMRLTMKTPEVRFIGAIHEAISPMLVPIKMLECVADHYGYLFKDKNGAVTELAREKSKRNLENLLKELESDEVGFNVYKEISDCYAMVDDIQKTMEYLDMGLEKNDHSHIAITEYYSRKAKVLFSLRDYKGCIEVVDKFFDPKDNPSHTKTLVSDFDMYGARAESYFRLGEYSKAVDDFVNFFRVYNSYSKGRLKTMDLLYNSISIQGENIGSIYQLFLQACIKAKKFNTAEEYASGFRISDYFGNNIYMLSFLHLRMQVLIGGHFKGINNFLAQLNDSYRKQFIRIARWYVYKAEDAKTLLDDLAVVSDKYQDFKDAIKIYRENMIENNRNLSDIADFIKNNGTRLNVDMLCIMISSEMDITPFVTSPDFDPTRAAHSVFADYPDFMPLLLNYDLTLISPEGLGKAAVFFGRAMVEADSANLDVIPYMEKYGDVGARWHEVFPDEKNVPDDIKAGTIVHNFVEAYKRRDYKTCINEMRFLASRARNFIPYIKKYKDYIQKELDAAAPKHEENPQLAEMAAVVKKNIRAMISAGNYGTARKTLGELANLTPGDPEIDMLYKEIEEVSNV